MTIELGHNNVLQVNDDDAYCPQCHPNKLPSTNNNNINTTAQLPNTPRGTSSLSSTPSAPPGIPTLSQQNDTQPQSISDTNNAIDFNFPFKLPTPRKKISEVNRTQHWPPETINHFGLDTFHFLDGCCIKCGSTNMITNKLSKSVKPILCSNGKPRFVQSVSISCGNCKTSIMAFEKSYVNTLSRDKKRKLNAIIVGQSYGIDMGLVRSLRNGACPNELERTARANLRAEWSMSKVIYEEFNPTGPDFPPFPEKYIPKAAQLNSAFLGDMENEKLWLKREIAAMKSSAALAIDCQVKVVKKCVKKGDGMSGIQALSVLGDTGIVLSHVIVPSDRKEYRNPAMEEVAARHEELPKFCYVDKDCCNGKQGGRTDEAKMYHGMEKKLDSKHLISRIGDTISSEHKQKATFVRGLSDSIYTSNTGDKFKLVLAVGSHRSLTPKEKKCEHVRHHIGCGKAICSRIINKVMIHATIDKENRAKYEGSSSYNPTTILTPSHWAYPLITTRVWKAIEQQLIHISNGCVSDDGEDMNIILHQKKYKNTNEMLPVHVSLRGTSNNEAFHSVVSAKSREWHQIGTELYDARAFWIVVHYNRKKLRMAGKKTLPDGISPSEAGSNEVVLTSIEDGKKLKFGFEYFYSVKGMNLDIVISRRRNLATSIKASIHNNDYNLLDDIGEVPDKVESEDISRIRAVLERALPDVSVFEDATKRIEMSAPTHLIKECTESLAQYKQPSKSHVHYPIRDNDLYTRSTASTLTVESSMPGLDSTGDTNLLRRQQAARDTMIKNNISIGMDDKEEGQRKNNCTVCFKNKDSLIFEGRRHLQLKKAERGVKLIWYCPLADPPNQYYALLEKRDELKRIRHKKRTRKRKAKRQNL